MRRYGMHYCCLFAHRNPSYIGSIGYYSAVTLTDIHFGMLMQALEDSGIANDTLVVVMADHGTQSWQDS